MIGRGAPRLDARRGGRYRAGMSRAAALLAAMGREPVNTDELYTRLGYPSLVGLGLVSYSAFRAELSRLADEGLVSYETAADGSTWWRRSGAGA
jgi:hypothetical protein